MSGAARGRMTMRATVQRDIATGSDALNLPTAPNWSTHIASLACYAWLDRMDELVDGRKTVVPERLRIMVPRGTDVTRRDRVSTITDRAATVLFAGPFLIDGDPELRTTHLELTLRQVD